MAPIALGSKHQDLLKAYFEVSKTSTPDWASIATKADFQTPKYARDSFTIVKNKLLATATSDSINLSERHIALLKATLEVMKAETDWEKVASAANFTTSKYARDSWAILKTKLCGGKAKSDTASPRKTPTKAKAVKATQSRKRKKPEADNDDDDGTSKPSASADEGSPTKAKKIKKSRKVKVEEPEVDEEGGEEPVTPAVQKEQAAVNEDSLEPEHEQEESFFEAEMFNMG